MKLQPARVGLQRLSLSIIAQNMIMAARENGTGRRRYAQIKSVPNDAVEHGPFLRPDSRLGRGGAPVIDRTLPRLLATSLRADLPARLLGRRCSGLNPGFLCVVA